MKEILIANHFRLRLMNILYQYMSKLSYFSLDLETSILDFLKS